MFVSRILSKLEGIWRVDAFGGLVSEVTENEVPKISISLSQIEATGIHAPLRYGRVTKTQTWIEEPLNRISKYLIGSCWENGIRINRLTPFKEKFLIDTSRIQFFTPGENPGFIEGYDGALLPPIAITLGRNLARLCDSSLYALVPVLENRSTKYLVIPCAELYRFYFKASDRLLNAVVRNDFDRYFKWEPPYLKVNARLSLIEQFTAYRSFWTKAGRRALILPSDHLKNVKISNANGGKKRPLALKSSFPFDGYTTLTVAGQKFSYAVNGEKIGALFVGNIIKCDKPADFDEVKVLSDIYSKIPELWNKQMGGSEDYSSNPFDEDELIEDVDDLPTAGSKPIAITMSNNSFSALKGMKFKHIHTDECQNPVYENDSGLAVKGIASGEIVSSGVNGIVLQESAFESRQDTIDRNLSDFISMVIYLRNLSSTRSWTVETRALDSVLEVEGELVTAFLSSKNRQRSWHIIKEDGRERLRQVVWVEVQIKPDEFIYLVEMELKKGDSGRSTQCIYAKDFGYMNDIDFRIFLGMTAAQNRWPNPNQSWRTKANELRALSFFERFVNVSFSHDGSSKSGSLDGGPFEWAKTLESKIRKLLFEIKS